MVIFLLLRIWSRNNKMRVFLGEHAPALDSLVFSHPNFNIFLYATTVNRNSCFACCVCT
jgi:hypothetical protein